MSSSSSILLKSQILGPNPWHRSLILGSRNAFHSGRRRRLLPLSSRLHLRTLQIRHSFVLPHPPLHLLHRFCESLVRPRMSTLADDSSSPDFKTVRAVIKGRVQGVFYRDWTVENAKELGLKGWVRNRRDGTVEALFSGSPDKVVEMEQRCRRGPPAAMVTGLDVSPCNDEPPGDRFERRPTA